MNLFAPFAKKKSLSVLALALCFCLAALLPASAAGIAGSLAPLDPAFLAFVNAGRTAGEGATERLGETPSPIDWSFARTAKTDVSFFDDLARERGLDFSSADPLPASFDLSAMGRVTPVLAQRGWGTCWAFASIESVESSVLVETKEAPDLSELHLAWFAIAGEGPSRPGFALEAEPGENPVFDTGGNSDMVLAVLSRGTGPVNESDAPYPDIPADTEEGWALWKSYVPDPPPSAETPPRFRLEGGLRFHDASDMKRAVMTVGGLHVSVNVSNRYIDGETGVIYCFADNAGTNHAVMLVGWDDAYPRENFASVDRTLPSADGAWKIQNSWGTETGEHGYYWVSYEDKSFPGQIGATGYLMESPDAYDGIYLHDPLGACEVWNGGDVEELEMANIYAAARNERIVSVGFYTCNTNVDYEIQVYRNIPADGDPGAGTPALAAPQRGTAGPIGYRAVRLDAPVSVSAGERFAVAVKLIETADTTPAGNLILSTETVVANYSDKAEINPGESFLGDGTDWADTYDYRNESFNLCVKAFTVAESTGGSSGCSALYGLPPLAAVALALALRRRR